MGQSVNFSTIRWVTLWVQKSDPFFENSYLDIFHQIVQARFEGLQSAVQVVTGGTSGGSVATHHVGVQHDDLDTTRHSKFVKKSHLPGK